MADLENLLQSPERVLEVVELEAREVADTFGRPRRSEVKEAAVVDSQQAAASVIPNEPSIIVFSKRGYIKRMRADTFNVQNRNGRGMLLPSSDQSNDLSPIAMLVSYSTTDSILWTVSLCDRPFNL